MGNHEILILRSHGKEDQAGAITMITKQHRDAKSKVQRFCLPTTSRVSLHYDYNQPVNKLPFPTICDGKTSKYLPIAHEDLSDILMKSLLVAVRGKGIHYFVVDDIHTDGNESLFQELADIGLDQHDVDFVLLAFDILQSRDILRHLSFNPET